MFHYFRVSKKSGLERAVGESRFSNEKVLSHSAEEFCR